MLIDRVYEKCRKLGSPIIVGIDPVWNRLPGEVRREALEGIDVPENMTDEMSFVCSSNAASKAFERFGIDILEAVEGIACVVKPQLAYFERCGAAGIEAYCNIVKRAREMGYFVIADAKRGDIGSTSEAYADAFLGRGQMEADFVTVNPYLGSDCVSEFVKLADSNDKGIFVLVKTSNPSSAELQDLETRSGKKIYEVVAERVEELASTRVGSCGYSQIGAVVGATYPRELAMLRKTMPHVTFLVPGFGAQGGTAADVAPAFGTGGFGALVNSSRGIIYAKREGYNYKDAMRAAARDMRQAFKDNAFV